MSDLREQQELCGQVERDAGDAYAAADATHPRPTWMDEEAMRQARREMEEARVALAMQQESARTLVYRLRDEVRGLWANPASAAWTTQKLLAALDDLERLEGGPQ